MIWAASVAAPSFNVTKAQGVSPHCGSGRATTINELTRMMIESSRQRLEPLMAPADWTAGSCRVGQTDKIQRLLGWTPRVPLQEGLARTYAWLLESSKG